MAEQVFGLSESDVNLIQQVLDRVLPSRINQYLQQTEHETQLNTPEVWIAWPHDSGGIPALVPGTGGDPDVPGSADCDLYVILGGPQGSPTLVQQGNLSRKVYNLTQSIIPQDWLTVIRDKAGSWIAQVGRAAYIEFSLTHSLAPGDPTAEVVVTDTENGPPVGTQLTISNPCGGMFDGDGPSGTYGQYDYQSGQAGIAIHMGSGNFHIIQMECPN